MTTYTLADLTAHNDAQDKFAHAMKVLQTAAKNLERSLTGEKRDWRAENSYREFMKISKYANDARKFFNASRDKFKNHDKAGKAELYIIPGTDLHTTAHTLDDGTRYRWDTNGTRIKIID